MNLKKHIHELNEYIDELEDEHEEIDTEDIQRSIQQDVQEIVEYVCEYGNYEKMKIIVGDVASNLELENLQDVQKYIADIHSRIVK